MNFWTALAVYFVVWWVILFAVLPFGIRTQEEAGEVTLGTTASAPVRPRLVRSAVATSIAAFVIVAALWVAVNDYGVSLETFANMFDARPGP
jgi:predicted secreted protein